MCEFVRWSGKDDNANEHGAANGSDDDDWRSQFIEGML